MARSAAPAPTTRPPDLLPLAEAARYLGVSPKWLYNRAKQGHVRHFQFRAPGQQRARMCFDLQDLGALRKSAEVKPT